MTTEPQTLVGVIEDIQIKDGKSDRGPWRLHKFKIRSPAGTRTYSTFDKSWPTNLTGGDTYRFTYVEKQDGEFANLTLTGAMVVDPSEFGAQPSSNGEFKQPYEPPTDEPKARVATETADEARARVRSEPQPEFKSPSRSYDQNQDITRRSIERQIALKVATRFVAETQNLWPTEGQTLEELIIRFADSGFAWLRKEAVDVRSSPAEPTSEPEGTEKPTESDGEPAFFPGGAFEEALRRGPPRTFTSLKEWISALRDDFGLDMKAKIEVVLERVGLPPIAQVGNFAEAYATIAHHFAEQGRSDG